MKSIKKILSLVNCVANSFNRDIINIQVQIDLFDFTKHYI